MSLKHFHHIFIAASWLLAFGFGAWCFLSPYAGKGAGVWGMAGIACGVALLSYHYWVWRKMKRLHLG